MKAITQEFIDEKLLSLGNSLLKKPWKNDWTEDNPTLGYCYVVSEALFHYVAHDYEPYCMNYGENYGVHWFLKRKSDGHVIDFTSNQFPFEVNHGIGRRKNFFKESVETKRGFISKRGYKIAKHLGLVE